MWAVLIIHLFPSEITIPAQDTKRGRKSFSDGTNICSIVIAFRTTSAFDMI